jgi:hypothetical protein
MEELFDSAANSEVKPDGQKPQPQQPQQQQRQSGESSIQGGKKLNFRPSISKLAKKPKPDKSKSDKDDNRTPAPWVWQSSAKLRSRKENAYAADHPNMKNSGARNIHAPTTPKTSLLQETENKSNPSAPSIVKNQKPSLHWSVSSSEGEDGRMGAWIAVIWYEGVDGNIRGYSTTSDFTEAEGCLTESETSHVKSIFVLIGKTGFFAHYPRSPDMRSSYRIAASTSTHRFRWYKHLYISTTSQ